MVIRWNDGAIVQTTVQLGEHTPFPAFTFTLLYRRHGIRIKYKMGQQAAFTTLRWALDRLLFPQCMSVQSYIEAGSGCYVLSSSTSKTVGTSYLFHLHTHPQSEKPSTSLSQFLHFLFHKEWKIPDVHKPRIIFTSMLQVSFKSTSSEARFQLILIYLARL